jgi:UDP-N-acetyl-D-glucosamine dehydrogenase
VQRYPLWKGVLLTAILVAAILLALPNWYGESPALQILAGLDEKGAEIHFCDPYVPTISVNGKSIDSLELTPQLLQSMDLIAILTDHSIFDYAMIAKFSPLIFDTRNAVKELGQTNVALL